MDTEYGSGAYTIASRENILFMRGLEQKKKRRNFTSFPSYAYCLNPSFMHFRFNQRLVNSQTITLFKRRKVIS